MTAPSPGPTRSRAGDRQVASVVAAEHLATAEERHARARATELAAQTDARAAEAASQLELKAAARRYKDEARERAAKRKKLKAAERRVRSEERRVALRAAAPDWGLSALWAAVIVAPLLLAWEAQADFAQHELGFAPETSWLFPLAVEAGAWACAFEAARRTKAGQEVGRLVMWMWALAGVAGTINFSHGWNKYGSIGHGLALGVLSVLGVLLHHVRQSLDRAAADEAAGRASLSLETRIGRWIWHPVLSLRALSIRARSDAGPAGAWEQAHVDRYGVGSASTRLQRKLGRALLRSQRKKALASAKAGNVPPGWTLLATAAATTADSGAEGPVVTQLVPTPPPAQPAEEASGGDVDTGSVAPQEDLLAGASSEDQFTEKLPRTEAAPDGAPTQTDGWGKFSPWELPAGSPGNPVRGNFSPRELPAASPGNPVPGKAARPGELPGQVPGDSSDERAEPEPATLPVDQRGASEPAAAAGQALDRTDRATAGRETSPHEHDRTTVNLTNSGREVSTEVDPPAPETPPAWSTKAGRAAILDRLPLARPIAAVAAERELEPELLEVAVAADALWRDDHRGRPAGRNPIKDALRDFSGRPVGSEAADTYRNAVRACHPSEWRPSDG